jgi:hypothetical protein
MKFMQEKVVKTPAANERFCVMAAVRPQKRQCGLETL